MSALLPHRRGASCAVSLLVLVAAAACSASGDAAGAGAQSSAAAATAPVRTYLDVHRCGPGALNLPGVTEAHARDLEVEGDHGVHYERYWVDELSGTIYCLVHAPSAAAATAVHREAHGLVADEVHEVRSSPWRREPAGDRQLFVATFECGPDPRTVTDLARHLDGFERTKPGEVRCLEYWLEPTDARAYALVEAATETAAAAILVAAPGLRASELLPVTAGH